MPAWTLLERDANYQAPLQSYSYIWWFEKALCAICCLESKPARASQAQCSAEPSPPPPSAAAAVPKGPINNFHPSAANCAGAPSDTIVNIVEHVGHAGSINKQAKCLPLLACLNVRNVSATSGSGIFSTA